MITSVPHEQLAHLSFPDAQVESVDLDLPARRMALRVDGAWLESEGVYALGAGELVINGWDQLEVRVYEHDTEQWAKVGFTPLRDICEFLADTSKIILRGFAKDSGLWAEVVAVGDQIQATYTAHPAAGWRG